MVTVKSPSHPERFRVHRGSNPDKYESKLLAARTFLEGEVVGFLTGTEAPKRYTTVQMSEAEHVELDSDIVFADHNCSPSVLFDTEKKEVRALKELHPGDEITFFYPSSEWDMDRGFECWCGSDKCQRKIVGAKYLKAGDFEGHFVNRHIKDLMAKRDGSTTKQSLPLH